MSLQNDRIHRFDELPSSALVSASELAALSGRSRTSIWRDVQEGRLAKPNKIGPNSVRWRVEQARQYLNGECCA
jgi:predicted DNA-binding transcriptional regulator AlpA